MPKAPENAPECPGAATPPDAAKDSFRDFLITEYNNIASAHFAAGTTITQFFQFYLLIIGLPITVAGIVQKLGGGTSATPPANAGTSATPPATTSILQLLADPLVPVLSFTVAILGLFLMWYIVTLRFDAIRYARTINGVRKQFYNAARLGIRDELAMRGLPRTITKPRYFDRLSFGGIVCSFATLNSAYMALTAWNVVLNHFCILDNLVKLAASYGWRLDISGLAGFAARPGSAEFAGIVFFVVFFACHWWAYFFFARYQGHRYLQKQRIGIDIDGVLGEHRTAFAKILPVVAKGKTLDPSSIKHIPLHECDCLKEGDGRTVSITQREEHAVFNTTTYWTTMPCYKDAPGVLRELKDAYRFHINIFTYRPWPNPAAYPDTMPGANHAWLTKNPLTWAATLRPHVGPGHLGRLWNRFLEWSRRTAMTNITKRWLGQHGIVHDHLVVERGNVYVADPRSHGRNRFRIAEHEDIRVFVEDDLGKARKLADICDVVYLIDHPYNQTNLLPNNIIRVKDWIEIKQHIRNNL